MDTIFQEIETELLQDLRDRWELLAEFTGHQIDDALIAHLSKHHCDTQIKTTDEPDEKNEVEESENCNDRWAILRTSDLYNQVRFKEVGNSKLVGKNFQKVRSEN